jgi:hypothetical protein
VKSETSEEKAEQPSNPEQALLHIPRSKDDDGGHDNNLAEDSIKFLLTLQVSGLQLAFVLKVSPSAVQLQLC